MPYRTIARRLVTALLLASPFAAGAAFTDLAGVTASSSGENHACAIAAGVAYCWGSNASGQLGNGTAADSPTPTAVVGLPSPVTAIAAGQSHSCAVAGATSDVYCWGSNSDAQLGPLASPDLCGTPANAPCAKTAQKSTPTASPNNTSNATAVAVGWYHTCAVVSGSVKCWGQQGGGRLGNGGTGFTTVAAGAATVVASTAGTAVVTASSNWSCALSGSVVRCWGGNGAGQLGDGTQNDSPTAVAVSPALNAVGLAAGDVHACAVTSTGGMACWGSNPFGQLGNNTTNSSSSPVAVTGIASGIPTTGTGRIAAGANHTCAVVSGALKCWGLNSFQQSDTVPTSPVLTPPVVARIASNVTAVSAGGYHSCALVGTTLQCFGRNASGQLGTGYGAIASSALAATPLTDGVARIASGSIHACAVRNGQVFCWGNNQNGQLGNGSFINSAVPVPVSGIASGATAVATGAAHSCAVVNGGVKCWGNNANGRLGNNTISSSATPVDVILTPGAPNVLLSNVTAIAAGTGHTCAIVTNAGFSNAYCWGANNTAQLGDGTTTQRTVATQTAGASTGGATAVAAGNNHTCAIVANDALKCWGGNSAGQLGTSAVGNTLQAAFSGSLLSGVTALAAGNGHTCAVQNGALKCFGNNGSGQLGDGTTVTPSPLGNLRIPIASGATAVAGGFGHTCAIVNGGLKCWGDGTKGQLGNGSLASSLSPIDVPGLAAGVNGVSAGSSHTCAVYGAGVTCFGFGEYGELGSPRYANAVTPVTVKVGFTSGTTILGDRNPSQSGQAVTFSAGVALNATSPAPGGTVAFRDGGVAIAGCGAVALAGTGTVRRATCTTTALAAGTRSITAEYSGDANYAGSASASLSQVVQVTTPTAFGFTHLTNAPLGALVTSGAATISGITVPVAISVTGGLYSIGCTGTFTSNPGTISPGATVCVRHVTPQALGATTTTTLTIGSGGAAFNSTTALAAGNTQPANIATGISHNLVITANGQVWGWGDNTSGKLGNGNTTVSTIPVRAAGLANVIAVAAGMGHSMALKADGTVWAWGLDDNGQLGNNGTSPDTCNIPGQFGTFACSLVPRQVTGIDNVVAISVGWRHSMALKRDGTVWSWGSGFSGQTGTGGGGNVPGQVAASGVFTRISAGYMHSVALRSDGTVWAWGMGNMGELGAAANSNTFTPTQVPGFTRPVTDLSAGGAFTLARLDDNTLVAWGSNRYGQLGDTTVTANQGFSSFRANPAPVTGLSATVVEFSAGTSHAVARLAGGTLWSWGLNNRQQTGIAASSATCGAFVNQPCLTLAQRIVGKDGAIRVSAGGAHTLTLRPDQSIEVFGDNGVGQRGDTTGNFGQAIAPPGNLARFDQSRYEPDQYLIPAGAFGTPGGVGRPGTAGALNLGTIGDGLAFGPQAVGTTSTAIVVSLNNVSDADAIAISGVAAAGTALAGEFGVSSQNCPATLNPGTSCTINLVFSPQAFGERTGSLVITSNATESTTLTFALYGAGTDGRAASTLSLNTTASTSATGQQVTFTAGIATAGPTLAGTVAFLDNGAPIAGCAAVVVAGANATCTTSALPVGVHPVTAEYSGNASVQPSSSPVVYQTVITVATPAAIPRLANISTRMQVLTGNDVLIGGFIIGGTQAKTVVVRARGPSLVPLGVPNAIANPRMDLFAGQAVIASNDDWQQAANAATLLASGFAPSDALESAIHITLGPGAYTAVVSGVGGVTGVGIIEVFEVDKPEVPLANISTRGQVLTGGDVMIGGFIIQGDNPQTVVVRARGPSLAAFGIVNPLANPVLQLFSGQTVIAANDNWQAAPNAAEIQARGFAPANAFESAILITLNPGAYTAIVTGAGGGTGVGIIEVFAQ